MWESWFNSSVNISYFLVFCLSLSQPKKKLLCPLYLLCWISTDETHLLNLQSISSSVWLAVNKPWLYFFSLILDHCFSHPSLYSGDWIFCVFTLTLLWLRINAYLPVFLKMLYSLFSLWVFSFIVLFAAFIQWIQKPGVAVLNYTQVLSHLVRLVSMRVFVFMCVTALWWSKVVTTSLYILKWVQCCSVATWGQYGHANAVMQSDAPNVCKLHVSLHLVQLWVFIIM